MIDKYSNLKIEQQQLDDERQDQIKQKTKLELDVKDLEDSVKEDAHLKVRSGKELEKLESTIKEKETELQLILPVYREKKSAEEECQIR